MKLTVCKVIFEVHLKYLPKLGLHKSNKALHTLIHPYIFLSSKEALYRHNLSELHFKRKSMANDLNSNLEESIKEKSQTLSNRISNKSDKHEDHIAKCQKNLAQKDHRTNNRE